MAVTTDQYNRLLSRITALELLMNNISVAMDKFVTLGQVNQLLVLLETDLDDVNTIVAALETRVTDIEEEDIT